MLAFNLRNVLAMKQIYKPYPWMRKQGIKDSATRRYLSGKAVQVNTRHIEILCHALHVLPNDLYIWQPDSKMRDIENHPLQEIRSGSPLPCVDAIASKLSPKSLRKAEEALRKIAEEEKEERKKKIEEKRKGKK